jgi:putative DNA replication and repair protein recF
MPDLAFDSQRHAQVSDDMSAGGGELTTSATSAMMLAAAQIFGHWTTESAAQSMGDTVQSFLTSFSTNMLNEAQYLSDLDTKVAQAVSDFTGTEEDARAALAAVGTALLALNQGESAQKVYSEKSIEQITSENTPAQSETGDESGAPVDTVVDSGPDEY